MFFRFTVAIVAIVLISLLGIAIEKRNLELRREISQQHYRTEELLETHARLRQQTQHLGATSRLMEATQNPEQQQELLHKSSKPHSLPLMRWQQPHAR